MPMSLLISNYDDVFNVKRHVRLAMWYFCIHIFLKKKNWLVRFKRNVCLSQIIRISK